jgi:hypothetical protein
MFAASLALRVVEKLSETALKGASGTLSRE